MKKITLITLITLAIYSCKTEKTVIKSNSSLIGKWDLVNYSGGLAGRGYTPTSPTTLEFTADSIFKRYVNSQVTAQGSYHVSTVSSPTGISSNGMVKDSVISYQSMPISQIYVIKSRDTLFLSDYNISDGFSYKYVRNK